MSEHLDLAAHAGDVVAQLLHLRGELEQRAAVARELLDLRQPLVDAAVLRLEALAQQLDAPARLLVVEQGGERLPGEGKRDDGEGDPAQHEAQYSPP